MWLKGFKLYLPFRGESVHSKNLEVTVCVCVCAGTHVHVCVCLSQQEKGRVVVSEGCSLRQQGESERALLCP